MLYRKSVWFRYLVILGLGAIVLSLICLVPGCGSDSTPKSAAGAKKEKSAQSDRDKDMRTVTTLLSDKGGVSPQMQHFDKMPGMPPPEELEAKRKASTEWYGKLSPKAEVLPGLTKEQLEANIEALRAKKADPNIQVLPGLTQGQADAKLMEGRKRPRPAEVLPGLTEEQAKTKTVQARQLQKAEDLGPQQVLPQK